jgi:hypothetical protein
LADPAAQLRALASDSVGDQVQAQIRLARSPLQALPLLEAELAAGRIAPERVRPLLSLALLMHELEPLIATSPRVHALIAADLARADQLAAQIAGHTHVDLSRLLDGREIAPGEDSVNARIAELLALRGFAVPVSRRLCTDKDPIGRGYGLHLLSSLGASGAAPAAEGLLDDHRSVEVSGACWTSTRTLAEMATAVLATSGSSFRSRARAAREPLTIAFEIERYLGAALQDPAYPAHSRFELINAMREMRGSDGGALAAPADWDSWWTDAHELWNAWWRVRGLEHTDATSRAAWHAWLEAHKADLREQRSQVRERPAQPASSAPRSPGEC